MEERPRHMVVDVRVGGGLGCCHGFRMRQKGGSAAVDPGPQDEVREKCCSSLVR
jgi:hypothetical protein